MIKEDSIGTAITASRTLMYGGAGTTGGAGIWTWMGENHEAIVATTSLGGFLVCLTGLILANYIKILHINTKDDKK